MFSIPRFCATLVYGAILLLCQSPAIAFPLTSEIAPYGEGVVAYGYATPESKSEAEFTEIFQDDPLNNTLRVNYYTKDGDPIAYKKLEFGDNRNIPEFFEFIDYRRGRALRITVKDNIATLKSIRVAADGSETLRSTDTVEIDSNTVIDAAFHRSILSNWEQLLAGELIKVKFMRVDKATLIPLRIKRNDCDIQDTVCFKISFDHMVLQAMTPTIYMNYDTNKNLTRYTGIGPITKINGKANPVDIKYGYVQ